MTEIAAAKFAQNDRIRQVLLDTGPSPLYEATTDGFWGTGYSFHSKFTVEEKGSGDNKLGAILMAIREGYSANSDQTSDQSSTDGSDSHHSETTQALDRVCP